MIHTHLTLVWVRGGNSWNWAEVTALILFIFTVVVEVEARVKLKRPGHVGVVGITAHLLSP